MSQINTNTIANELGIGGPDFVGMPSVGGDPVVESESNTDGEWTRWADGTQQCYRYFGTVTFPTTFYVSLSYTHPLAFTGSPSTAVSGFLSTDAGGNRIGAVSILSSTTTTFGPRG